MSFNRAQWQTSRDPPLALVHMFTTAQVVAARRENTSTLTLQLAVTLSLTLALFLADPTPLTLDP